MIEDKWINFVLLNGWRLKAEVDEETGDMNILVSNEKGEVTVGEVDDWKQEEYTEVYKLAKNEKENK
jgi:prophage maintenance system killer protein